jgi:hypothetical protein
VTRRPDVDPWQRGADVVSGPGEPADMGTPRPAEVRARTRAGHALERRGFALRDPEPVADGVAVYGDRRDGVRLGALGFDLVDALYRLADVADGRMAPSRINRGHPGPTT